MGAGGIAFFICLCLLGLNLAAAADPAEDSRRAEELKRLRDRIEALQTGLERTRGQRNALEDELRTVERRVGATAADLHRIEGRLAGERARLEALRAQQAKEQDRLHGQRRYLAEQVRAAYAMGRQEYLKLLLNQEDPGRVSRALTYYRYLTQARAARIGEIKAILARLAEFAARIAAQTRELETLHAAHILSKAELEKSRDERTLVLARLNTQLESKAQEIERLKRDEEQLNRLVQGLAATLDEIKDEAPAGPRFDGALGRLHLPVRGKISAFFGDPRHGGQLRWDGLFVDAPEGREVNAVFRGRVAFADWFRGFGLLLILDHGGGYMSLYGHNQTVYKQVGDWVEAGEALGAVGNSGGLEQAGLYFEVRHNGRPRDPLLWCRTQ